jgi:hypothetical protein
VCLTGLTGVKLFCGSRQLSLAGTSLTGGAHRLTGVGQWTRGLVFRCVLGSEGYVLVPRFSSTPVATWTWPIWVVSRRRVLEAVFILLESSSPSRRIFIGSHSLPPLSGSPYWSFKGVRDLSSSSDLALCLCLAFDRLLEFLFFVSFLFLFSLVTLYGCQCTHQVGD